MSILKDLDLPPQYLPRISYHQQQQQQSNLQTACRLNPTLWLKILSILVHPSLTPQQKSQAYSFLHSSVRLVAKELYLVSMHLLRRHYLHAYSSRIQKPYSSDPLNQITHHDSQGKKGTHSFNQNSTASTSRQRIEGEDPAPAYTSNDEHRAEASHSLMTSSTNDNTLTELEKAPTRESRILDLFIAASMTVDTQAEESELILISDLDDLFALYQPQSRLEDLIHLYGLQYSTLVSTPSNNRDSRISFTDLSVKFSLRNVSIRLPCLSVNSSRNSIRKAVVTVERTRDQRLEHTARQLVVRLGESGLKRNENDEGLVWYE